MISLDDVRDTLFKKGISIESEERVDACRETLVRVSNGDRKATIAVSDDGYIAIAYSRPTKPTKARFMRWADRVEHYLKTGEEV